MTLGGVGNQAVDAAEQKMQKDQKIDHFSLQKMHIFLY
jgi:hypothetical protein